MRKKATIVYLSVLALLLASTAAALLDGGYHIAGGIIAGIAFGSTISSLVPYFISMYFFKKFDKSPSKEVKYKIVGFLFFSFCFPVKIWIILMNLDLLIKGGERWAFG